MFSLSLFTGEGEGEGEGEALANSARPGETILRASGLQYSIVQSVTVDDFTLEEGLPTICKGRSTDVGSREGDGGGGSVGEVDGGGSGGRGEVIVGSSLGKISSRDAAEFLVSALCDQAVWDRTVQISSAAASPK